MLPRAREVRSKQVKGGAGASGAQGDVGRCGEIWGDHMFRMTWYIRYRLGSSCRLDSK